MHASGVKRRRRVVRLSESASVDLRRVMERERASGLLSRVMLLAPEDQWLLDQHLGHGRAIAEIARQIGRSPSSLRERVRRLIGRIESPAYGLALTGVSSWDATARACVLACVGRGISMRRAARELGIGEHVVRARMREFAWTLRLMAERERGAAAPGALIAKGVAA
ncbi:MAG: hypothetical protein KF902_14425 [Phycisphaeraceae bacterium]|nr:hypothetical protein [Phycisphaeraceae bacterium]MBX3361460.1 hypothetical protein [Phycisphaeraceae bacterium]